MGCRATWSKQASIVRDGWKLMNRDRVLRSMLIQIQKQVMIHLQLYNLGTDPARKTMLQVTIPIVKE
jgi:hypothetical protein